MSYMTDRKRADRWGSAKSGTQHFWRMKVQSVALLVLIPLFLIAVAPIIGADYAAVSDHFARPLPALIAALTITGRAVAAGGGTSNGQRTLSTP